MCVVIRKRHPPKEDEGDLRLCIVSHCVDVTKQNTKTEVSLQLSYNIVTTAKKCIRVLVRHKNNDQLHGSLVIGHFLVEYDSFTRSVKPASELIYIITTVLTLMA